MPVDRFDRDAFGAVRSQSKDAAARHEIAWGNVAGLQHNIDEVGKQN